MYDNIPSVNDATSVETAAAAPVASSEADGVKLQIARYTTANDRIKNLVAARQNWQDTVYKTSNDMLYAILQDCYRLYNDMCSKGAEAQALRECLKIYASARQIVFADSTHTMTQIVRCVFDGNRRRISAYSIVLRAALSCSPRVPVEKLADFIRERGGVEEVRLGKSPSAMSAAEKVKAAIEAVKTEKLAVVNSPAIAERLDAAKVDEQLVLIATQGADGELTINAVVARQGVLNAALVAYYSAHKAAIKTSEAEKVEVEAKDAEAARMRQLVVKAAAV